MRMRGVSLKQEAVYIDSKKQDKLNQEFKQPGKQDRDRNCQAWKINLTEYGGIGNKCAGNFIEAIGKIIPERKTEQIKSKRRYIRWRWYFGNIAKHNSENNAGKYRLNNKPEGA